MKAKRNIIKIDEALCNGCGSCVEGCHEGALQMIDGKARIVSELYCDGLGACIGDCPVGAITLETREAEPYDEIAVMERIVPKGEATILAHLKHLKDHGEKQYLQQGVQYLQEKKIDIDLSSIKCSSNKYGNEAASIIASDSSFKYNASNPPFACGCPGSMERSLVKENPATLAGSPQTIQNIRPDDPSPAVTSQLSHWPVQLHLLNPHAGFFQGADIVLAADCTAYAYAGFHHRFLRNHALAIACPKLDSNKESYIAKIIEMIDTARINTLTTIIMEVPCCGGLLQLVKMAAEQASRKVPIKKVVISLQGEIKEECWI